MFNKKQIKYCLSVVWLCTVQCFNDTVLKIIMPSSLEDYFIACLSFLWLIIESMHWMACCKLIINAVDFASIDHMHMTSQKGAHLRWGSNEALPRASLPSMQPWGQPLHATPPGWPAQARALRGWVPMNAHCQHNTCALRDTSLASLLWRCDPFVTSMHKVIGILLDFLFGNPSFKFWNKRCFHFFGYLHVCSMAFNLSTTVSGSAVCTLHTIFAFPCEV